MTGKRKAATEGTRRGSRESNVFRRVHRTAESAESQRIRLVRYLARHGHVDTLEARDRLAIMSVAARIFELKRSGFSILSIPDEDSRIATYHLIGVSER